MHVVMESETVGGGKYTGAMGPQGKEGMEGGERRQSRNILGVKLECAWLVIFQINKTTGCSQ